jgi:tRNA A-37 threonylcarbamoyl transferase component Bud32
MGDAAIQLTTGFILNNRYTVDRELGRGGVGVVYLARDEQLHSRQVVIKVLLEESYRDEWIKTKFRQEMEALSRLDHPGIVNLLDTGDLPDGRPFLVMQYVEGVLLRSLISPQGMDFERAASLIRQVGDALSAAHDRGVLHRDLKPENIMIQSPGQGELAKIIDFGLAKVLNSRVAESTAIPNVAGSFSYMSPEQLMARPVSQASDVYSFGVIVYEMLTGRRPHNPDSLFQLLDMLRAGVRVKSRDLRPSLPEAVDVAVLKALSYEPRSRQATAAEFGRQVALALVGGDSGHIPAPETARLSLHADRAAQPSLRAAWLGVALLICAILVMVKTSFFRFQSNWQFLTHPAVLCLILLLVALFGILRAKRSVLIDRFAQHRVAIVGVLAASAALLLGANMHREAIAGGLMQGEPQTQSCCVLKYSDPRGYRYTFQENSYYRIRIMPDRFNKISDYQLRIVLPPELEFADFYADRAFPVDAPLSLEPSSTNDVLKLAFPADSISAPRLLLFTTKSRNSAGAGPIRVELKTPGVSSTYAF